MRQFLFIALLLVEALAVGQGFNERYDAFGWERPQGAWGLEQTDNGYCVISFSYDADSLSPDSFFFHHSIVLSFLDANGLVINENRSFREGYGTYPGWANCCDTVGNGFVIGGSTASPTPVVQEVYLMRFDSDGDTLWTKVFGGTNEDWVGQQVKSTADGGFIIVGETDANGSTDAFVLKTDGLGNEQWRETYGGGSTENFITSSEMTNGYVLGGLKYFGTDNLDNWVLRVDSMGGTIWSKVWGGPFRETNAYTELLADSNLLVASSWAYSLSPDSRTPYLAKLDKTDGSFIWEHEYGEPTYSTTFFAAKERYNGDIIACGVSYASGDQQGLLLRANSQGDSIWMRTYYYVDNIMDDGQGRFWDVLPTADGGFIAAGVAYHSATIGYPAGYSQDTWVVKVDSMGCIIPGCDITGVEEIITNLTDALQIWPNPLQSNGTLHGSLELPSNFQLKNAQLTLVDGLGRLVLQETLNGFTFELQLPNLGSGVYYLHLSDGKRWISGSKVVVR